MPRSISPRLLINGAVILLALVVVALTAIWLSKAHTDYRLTQRARIAGELETDLLDVARLFALERGYTAALLSVTSAERTALYRRVISIRSLSDTAWERAYKTADRLIVVTPRSTILREELEDTRLLYWELQSLRKRIDANFEENQLVPQSRAWFSSVTNLIDHITLLRSAAESLSSTRLHEEELWLLRGWLWMASEHAGRERALLSEYIAKREPIPAVLKSNLAARAELTEHLVEEFVDYSAPYLNHDDDLVRANRALLTRFLDEYTALRGRILEAAGSGRYPVDVDDWLQSATEAIDTLHAATAALTKRIDKGLDQVLHQRYWQLTGVMLLFLLALGAVSVAIYRVNQTAARLVTQRRLAEQRYEEAQTEMRARVRIEAQLRESEKRARLIMNSVPALIAYMDKGLNFKFLNQRLVDFVGVEPEQFVGHHLSDLLGAKLYELVSPHYEKALEGYAVTYEGSQRHKDDGVCWLQISLVPNIDAKGSTEGIYAMALDITDRRTMEEALRASQASFHSLVERNAIGIVVINEQKQVLFANAAAKRMLGSMPEALDLVLTTPGQVAELPIRSEGHISGVAEVSVGATDWNGEPATLLMIEDVTTRKEAQRAAEFLTQHDGITGLPNRTLFQDRLELALRRIGSQKGVLALAVIDIDRFSRINNAYGTAAGDHVLAEVAWRLSGAIDGYDTVARLGADQFGLLLESADNRAAVDRVYEQILQSFSQPIDINGEEIRTTVSIGAALYPTDATSIDALQNCAFAALKFAIRSGGDNVQFYEPGMADVVSEHVRLETDLSHALERNELELHYQPRIDARTGAINGMEALVRWRHPTLGMVSPAEFIPLAETTGLILPIGRWVLHEACRQTETWRASGLPAVRVSVNLSTMQFAREDVLKLVTAALEATGLPAVLLELEITESLLMQNAESAAFTLGALRDLGVCCSIDDFGTGYSSLGYLRRFPLHALKVDRSFIRMLPNNPEDVAITCAILSMARDLNLKVVAEGVETPEQAAFLKLRGCDEIQGFLFSKPLPSDGFEQLLKDRTRYSLLSETDQEDLRTVLLLDDDNNVLAALEREFRSTDYRVLKASLPEDALDILATNQVGVVISDMRMPTMSGIEFMRRCKRIHPDVVRVMMSGHTDLDNLLDAINHGAIYKFLLKPLKSEQLHESVKDAFRHYEMTRENEDLRRRLIGATSLPVET